MALPGRRRKVLDVYRLIRPILFMLDAEHSHELALSTLAALSRSAPALRLLRRFGSARLPALPCTFAGLQLPNPLGLAAGMDKEAAAFPAIAALGFGWVEVGTVTPLPQPGNQRPRLFRISDDQALINRMGFNSGGLEPFTGNLRRLRKSTRTVVGVNIGKNAATPIERAVDDYTQAMDQVYPLADYIAVNVSSPNTRSLRDLQNADHLGRLAETLRSHRDGLCPQGSQPVPLFLKIAPDLSAEEVAVIADAVREQQLDGVIATNTTVQRPCGDSGTYAEQGGLSGRPLRALSTATVDHLYRQLGTSVPIMGVGGITSVEDVIEKVARGAQVVQIYTSFVYEGPEVIRKILLGLEQRMYSAKISDWSSFSHSLRA